MSYYTIVSYFIWVIGLLIFLFFVKSRSIQQLSVGSYLDQCEEAAAYLACNMDLVQALAYTLEELKKAGELENTVICLSGDHYPYGMDPATWDEFYGGPMETDFDVFHSTLILWSGDMTEPVVIEKPCESLDILPTLLNLFGLEYDSRLLAGRDILAAEPGAQLVYGLRPGVTRDMLRQAFETEAPLEPLLRFVPVQAGDVFYITAGMEHAIGGGILL